MRTTKFRGKSIDNNNWIYGYACFDSSKENAAIINKQGGNEMQHWAVDPETVSEFTGLHDRNGKEIYENDVLSFDKIAHIYKNCPITVIGVVVYANGRYEVETKNVINHNFLEQSSIHFGIKVMDWIHLPEFHKSEIIGNIYENPELL